MTVLDDFLGTVVPRLVEADTALHHGDPGPAERLTRLVGDP